FFFQAEDGIRDDLVTGVQTCALPILSQSDVVWTQQKLAKILSVGDVVYVKVLGIDPAGKARVSLEQDSGAQGALLAIDNASGDRSEERRVGKEGRCGWRAGGGERGRV